MIPASLKGKELEALLLEAAKREESAGRLTMSRYGVQGVTFGGKTILVPSLPDFEGCLPGGRQIIIEAKCCQGSAFPLADDHFRDRQYRHMATRARFGALAFLVIHFAERYLKTTGTDPGMTVAVPVDEQMQFWMAYTNREARTLSRSEATTIGTIVPWNVPKGCRKPLPNLMAFLMPTHPCNRPATLQDTPVPAPLTEHDAWELFPQYEDFPAP